ncbi:DUF397 domain-containing protein [Pseudonocardia spinosispora]|uniref:DUF397 domain-containing protein n=1 Tax=Pseudonocardia spinosispora TaxID=103441 RepID=UPI000A025A9F|nr:DUF397 domain-containing protein [Pseudonocardia spinosispora]
MAQPAHTTAARPPDNQCVEVAVLPNGSVLLRDSKIGTTSPTLTFTPTQWQTFLTTARH